MYAVESIMAAIGVDIPTRCGVDAIELVSMLPELVFIEEYVKEERLKVVDVVSDLTVSVVTDGCVVNKMFGKFVDCAKGEDINLVRRDEVGNTVAVDGELISLMTVVVLSVGFVLTVVNCCLVASVVSGCCGVVLFKDGSKLCVAGRLLTVCCEIPVELKVSFALIVVGDVRPLALVIVGVDGCMVIDTGVVIVESDEIFVCV